MAPRTLARSRLATGWAHPYSDPSIFYADGGDGAPAETPVSVEPEPADEPADDWTPPSREEYEATVAKLKTASGEAAARRKYLKQHGIDPKTGNKIETDETEPEPEPSKGDQPQGLTQAELKRAVEKAVTETQLTGQRQMRTFAVGFNKALSEAGWNGTRLDSLMKLLDLDEVDIDEGEITGLSEQLETLKGEWPEFFKRARNSANASNGSGGSGQNGVPAAKVDAADKPAPKAEPKGWAERVAEKALRG